MKGWVVPVLRKERERTSVDSNMTSSHNLDISKMNGFWSDLS